MKKQHWTKKLSEENKQLKKDNKKLITRLEVLRQDCEELMDNLDLIKKEFDSLCLKHSKLKNHWLVKLFKL
jgi:predicted NACHT family NTPase